MEEEEMIEVQEEEEEELLDRQPGSILLPGDFVAKLKSNQQVKLGGGLVQVGEELIATKAGLLCSKPPKKWINNRQMRYVPCLEDVIIGVVVESHSDGFKVDIGSAFLATLSMDSFEMTSRKNRKEFPVGTLVYARMTVANKDLEPEIACVATNGKSEGFGLLEGGLMIRCSLSLSRTLISNDCVVLKLLGEKIRYETAIGLNGRVWIRCDSPADTVLVCNTILSSEGLSDSQIGLLVRQNLTTLRS